MPSDVKKATYLLEKFVNQPQRILYIECPSCGREIVLDAECKFNHNTDIFLPEDRLEGHERFCGCGQWIQIATLLQVKNKDEKGVINNA